MVGRFVPTLDLTSEDDDTNSHMSDIPFQHSASAHVASDISGVVTFAQAEGNLMRNNPIPSDTGVNPWQIQHLCAYHQGSFAALLPQETVHVVPQRAREALNNQRETARRPLLHQQG